MRRAGAYSRPERCHDYYMNVASFPETSIFAPVTTAVGARAEGWDCRELPAGQMPMLTLLRGLACLLLALA